MADEFYVGYLPESPPGIARTTRLAVVAVFLAGLAVAAVLALTQAPFDEGWFEFGVDRQVEGILIESPYPALVVPVVEENGRRFVTHHLVAFGKHGADSMVQGLDGRPVRVSGSRIYNEQQQMIEVHAIEPLAGAAAEALEGLLPGADIALGPMVLVGEIVDAKCHLGVMKPGRGKPHRACAVRCISGGIPPVLRIRDTAGRVDYLLLTGRDGEPVNDRILDLVADPVEISGDVFRRGDLLVLRADPATYRRLEE